MGDEVGDKGEDEGGSEGYRNIDVLGINWVWWDASGFNGLVSSPSTGDVPSGHLPTSWGTCMVGRMWASRGYLIWQRELTRLVLVLVLELRTLVLLPQHLP